MLHVGLDLSRTRLDVHVMDETGAPVAVTTAAPDAGGLASLAYRLRERGGGRAPTCCSQPVCRRRAHTTSLCDRVHRLREVEHLLGRQLAMAEGRSIEMPALIKEEKFEGWLADRRRRELAPLRDGEPLVCRIRDLQPYQRQDQDSGRIPSATTIGQGPPPQPSQP